MEFDSMVVYRTWMETFDDLDNETVGEIIKMIMHYGMNGEDISDNMSPAARAIFKMSKGNIDASNQKRINGAKGGKAKGKQAESESQADEKQTASKPQANEKQPTSNKDKDVNKDVNRDVNNNNIKTSSSPRSATDARFDIFWQTYPRKAKRKDAEKAWKKINPDKDLFDKIIKAVSDWRFSEQWTKDGGQYIPYPATWLNGGQWEDEIPKVRTPVKKNQFSNFPQRGYTETDYNELERRMLTERRRTG
jgi:hypothetical protein